MARRSGAILPQEYLKGLWWIVRYLPKRYKDESLSAPMEPVVTCWNLYLIHLTNNYNALCRKQKGRFRAPSKSYY
jgi:hypothetical protein